MNFTDSDIKLINNLGIDKETVEKQLFRFKNGFPDIVLCGNVLPGSGLKKLSTDELASYIDIYDRESANKQLVKFVPASGAASRMFKMLFNFLEGIISADDPQITEFFNRNKGFAFSDELVSLFEKSGENIETKQGKKKLVELLLSEDGLEYGKLPKALLTFHKYDDGTTTKAIDEHLIEGTQYCAQKLGKVSLHFTVSQEHVELIETHLQTVVPALEKRYSKKFDLSFSLQDTATNTLAVDLKNEPFRLNNGELLFRPGGHGALLMNLNQIDADIVFIKNIDNVAAQWLLDDTVQHKKALGGVLINTQSTIFNYCKVLEGSDEMDDKIQNEIVVFMQNQLGFKIPTAFAEMDNNARKNLLFSKLNRPLRICGVVENSNTGGGPFWVKHTDGAESLQLVETDQVNKNNADQVKILQSSEYANITDLACAVRDYKGEKFNLAEFSDPDAGFISQKSVDGKDLKAMELPGLWNGAMSDWNTSFVEVPMSTFNPVKTVLDLLKKEHQGVPAK